MADLELSRAGFSKGATERRIEKDRIVSKSLASPRRRRYGAFYNSFRFEQHVLAVSQCTCTHETSRGPGGCARTQRVVNQRKLLPVCGRRSAEAGALDSGSAVQSVDFQP